jgi:hypothetical protein
LRLRMRGAGPVFTLEGDRISALQAFPSYEEAVAAAASD